MPKDDDAGERRRKGKGEIGSGKRGKTFIWKNGMSLFQERRRFIIN